MTSPGEYDRLRVGYAIGHAAYQRYLLGEPADLAVLWIERQIDAKVAEYGLTAEQREDLADVVYCEDQVDTE